MYLYCVQFIVIIIPHCVHITPIGQSCHILLFMCYKNVNATLKCVEQQMTLTMTVIAYRHESVRVLPSVAVLVF
jgi:hypothetical protein